jgi:hypothetical protein
MNTRRSFQPVTSAAMQAALRRVAERHGYASSRGPRHGQGSPSALVQALDAGELATVLLDSDERWHIIAELERHADAVDGWLADGIRAVADQLRAAAEREQQLDADELADYLPGAREPKVEKIV